IGKEAPRQRQRRQRDQLYSQIPAKKLPEHYRMITVIKEWFTKKQVDRKKSVNQLLSVYVFPCLRVYKCSATRLRQIEPIFAELQASRHRVDGGLFVGVQHRQQT